ncbi:MAG TPA: tyrosine-type recombinase/integrase, partial [Candidatus Obscuribacterales bacterium]
VAGDLTLARAEELVRRLHKLANPEFKAVSLAQFWSDWLDEQKRHVVASTVNGYKNDYDLFADALGARIMDAPISSVTTKQISVALEKAQKQGNGKGKSTRRASTINKALATLRRVMEDAVAKRLVTHNPAKQCRSLSQQDSTQRAPFTAKEVREMIGHPDTSDEWQGAITLAAHTGLRLGDIVNLSEKHLDVARLVIMPSKTSKQKKVITVPLTPPCLAWVKGRKGDYFPTLKKQETATCSMQFSAIMSRAKVPKTVELPGGFTASRSFHSLRHTFASWLADADIHADVRQKLTGHSSSKIHAQYSHHDEALDRAIGTLPEL